MYWVIQEVRGNYVAHGPYKSIDAAKNRYSRISGGEIFLFRSWAETPDEAVQEFRDEQLRRL